MGSRIDRAFIDEYSGRYPLGAREEHLLATVGPAVAARGHYEPVEFFAVCAWKSVRATNYASRNSNDDIRDITGLAFRAPERLQHRVLMLLNGVGRPMASALLTVPWPDAFTVIDVRALATLRAHSELGGADASYADYLQICRRLADETSSDLRTVDRALWAWRAPVSS